MWIRTTVRLAVGVAAAFALAFAAHWVVAHDHPAARPAAVLVKVQRDSQSVLLFNGTVSLAATNSTALGALLAASQGANFTVTVSHQYGEPFVVEIAGVHNAGACGWVFSVDGVRGARGAGSATVATGQVVDWYWGCG